MKTCRSIVIAALAAFATSGALAQEFDLDALIAAARGEPPLAIFDSTGKIVDMAAGFASKYGVQATGSKSKASAQLETIIREVQSGNVQTDVSLISDPAAVIGQLLPSGFVESWAPPDLAGDIDANAQTPLLVVSSPNIFTYNTKLFDSCPISNIWQLTEPKWKGRVSMQDPLGKPSYTDWFNQMRSHADGKIAASV